MYVSREGSGMYEGGYLYGIDAETTPPEPCTARIHPGGLTQKVCLDQARAGGCQACFFIVLILSDPH